VLGKLDLAALPGVASGMAIEAVKAAIVEKIGAPLGLDAIQAAAAIITVASDHLASAIRLVSIEKGYDPRDFALFPFGGAGPLHAVGLARELGVPTVLVPRFPGLTSALGCILADLRHDFVRTLNQPLMSVDPAMVDRLYSEYEAEGRALVEAEGVPVTGIDTVFEADLLYRGQSHVMRVAVERPFRPASVLASLEARYRERFDIELKEMTPVLSNLRTATFGRRSRLDFSIFAPQSAGQVEDARQGARSVYFDGRWFDTPVYRRDRLAVGTTIEGPAIVAQLDTTILIDPGARAEVDAVGNLVIAVGERPI
ncbi:MAG: hydantoinase/oxoprolinase family protein, partial [Solimonas sp.]